MKGKFLSFIGILIVMLGCSSKESARQRIEKAEQALYGNNDQMDFKEDKVDEAIQAYTAYSQQYTKDSMAPEYLFKAADLYRLKGKPEKALDIYETIHSKYSDYRKAPHSLFLQGFVYENETGQIKKAEKKYSTFIEKYPEHDLADDARFSLKNLGKTPEQIIDDFQKKEKAKAEQKN